MDVPLSLPLTAFSDSDGMSLEEFVVSVVECDDGRKRISYSGNFTSCPLCSDIMVVSKSHIEGIIEIVDLGRTSLSIALRRLGYVTWPGYSEVDLDLRTDLVALIRSVRYNLRLGTGISMFSGLFCFVSPL